MKISDLLSVIQEGEVRVFILVNKGTEDEDVLVVGSFDVSDHVVKFYSWDNFGSRYSESFLLNSEFHTCLTSAYYLSVFLN